MSAFAFENTYARLPERFFARQSPEVFPEPALVRLNHGLAEELGLDPKTLAGPDGVQVLAGRRVPDGAEPLAMAYAGHQFGGWSPQLGDGRAILLGEIVAPDGTRLDVQLKGAGRTPYSRMGDGRAALGPVLREYVISEAMHALGVRTTRSLAAVTTGEAVVRDGPLPGAVLTRIARSHVRVGTFQYFFARQDVDALRVLTDYALERHYPDATGATPARALLDAVVAAQARLVARWMGVGFIHGVMNTDNMSVAGETIDYGPCAFMDAYHPNTVYSSIDQHGRYAYANQPSMAHWNLARLAQSLLPLLAESEEEAVAEGQAAVDAFAGLYEAAWVAEMRGKLGFATAAEGDDSLAQDLLSAMAEGGADFTLTFRALSSLPGVRSETSDDAVRALFSTGDAPTGWLDRWRSRLAAESSDDDKRREAMRARNPAVIPRNHMVEEALTAANRNDLGPLEALLSALKDPYADAPADARIARPPEPGEEVRETFCGT